MGKTTLCQRIVYEWANPQKRLWEGYFSTIFWIPLRRLRNLPPECNSIESLLQTLYFPDEPDTLSAFRALLADPQYVSSALWLLDGYDEVQVDLTESVKNILYQLLKKKRMLLTSRAHAMGNLTDYFNTKGIVGGQRQEYYELIGFRPREVREYMDCRVGSN